MWTSKVRNPMKYACTLAVVASFLAGCQDKVARQDQFPPEDQVRSVDRIAELQAASGARADATLYAHHFDGDALNSTGEEKLEMILSRPHKGGPVTIYVVDSDAAKVRRDAVTKYLADHKMDTDVKVAIGNN